MRDPYEVLGVSREASDEEIKRAYKDMARRYSDDSSPVAERRMHEINEAYDEIVLNRGGFSSSRSSSNANNAYGSSYGANYSDYSDIRGKIRNGRLEDAQVLLDGVPANARTAEWHYLKGVVQQRRGWLDDAAENFRVACEKDPNNREYAAARENLETSRSGGYRTSRGSNKSGCGACDICSGLICADCLCECCGGDLIPCC